MSRHRRIVHGGEVYRWSRRYRRYRRARSPIPSWFRDDPLTATLAYLSVSGLIAVGVLLIWALAR